jgi:hypothetical protein
MRARPPAWGSPLLLRRAAAALAMLTVAALYVVSARRLPVGVLNDDAANILLARSLSHGRYAFPGGLGAPEQFLPLFPALLALPVRLAQPHWELLRFVPLAFAALALFLAWRLARRFMSDEAAGAAVLLAALNPVLLGLGGLVLPYTAFLALSLALIDGAGAEPTPRTFVLLTMGAALAPLLRPHGAVLIAALALALWHRDGWRRAGAFSLLSLLPSAAWALYNRRGGVSHDYIGIWRDHLASLAGGTSLLERGSQILLKMFGEGFLIVPEFSEPGQYALALGTLALALAGAVRLLKKRDDPRAFVLSAYTAGVILLHLTWKWIGNRYVIPIVPLLWILIVAAAAPLLHKRRNLGWVLLGVFVALPLRLERIYALNGLDGEARFEPETMAWIRENVPPSARLESVKDYTVALLTDHPCSTQPIVAHAGDWLTLAERGGIDYLHLQLPRPNDEFGVADLPDAYQPFLARWLGATKETKEVYRNLGEGSMIFRLTHHDLDARPK